MKESFGYKVFKLFDIILLMMIALVSLYPMLYVLFASLSDSAIFMHHQGLLLTPLSLTIQSYIQVTRHPMIVSGYQNTLIILVGGLCVNMLFTVMGAYVLASPEFKLRKTANQFVVFTMLFSGGIVPLYLTVRTYGLLQNDTSTMVAGGGDTIGMAETVKYAVIIVSTLPILMLYPFLQRYFVKGVMIGAIKG